MPSIDEQLQTLARGTAQIVPVDALKAKLEKSTLTSKPLRAKLGIDPTASDIHLGFAVVLRKLRQFQDFGHEVDLVIGSFTAMIGDPTGKSVTRPRLSEEQVHANAETYKQQLLKILDESKTTFSWNHEWLGAMTFKEVIEVTSKFTVARILEREDFSNRLASGQPLHMHETMYPIAQALDSVHLNSDVELGGTDQTFNILAGRDLMRENGQEPQVALTMPLLVGTDGTQKMSKSYGNYVGIFEPPAEQFGKTLSIPDEAMRQWFELCTDVPMEEVEALLTGHPMDAKKRLAREIVTLYHSAEDAAKAQAAWEHQFSQRAVPEDMPEVAVPAEDLNEAGAIWIGKLLQTAGFAKGTNEAKRHVQNGAVQLNGTKITELNTDVTIEDGAVLKVGRKYVKLRR